MKPLLIVTLLLFPLVVAAQEPSIAEDSPLTVLSARWSRDRQPIENAASGSSILPPQPAMTRDNKNFEKQRRINAPPGERDPNADTTDTRGNELERINQLARESENKPMMEGFAYLVKVQNGGPKVIQNIFWEYQFRETSNPSNLVRRQFICSAKIKPSQEKSLQAFSRLGPSEVIDVKSLGKNAGSQFEGEVRINRIEFSDGTFWQRKDWEISQHKLNEKARAETKNLPVCRGL
jgi:hypothetical protein